MHPKSIFCNHNYNYSEIALPNGQKRIKEICNKCEISKIYCLHDYEVISKTTQHGSNLDNFKGSIAVFSEIKEFLNSCTEILFKCKNCGDLHKESLKGKEAGY